jgi:hypothetical protein
MKALEGQTAGSNTAREVRGSGLGLRPRVIPARLPRVRAVEMEDILCFFFPVLLLLALIVSGCTSESKAKEQARMAYLAGQQDALVRLHQQQVPSVTIVGHVQSPMIPWTPDLTLSKAIVASGYLGLHDPTQIFIVRNGQAIPVEPKQLLSGEDVPLESGDMVQIK